MRQGMLFVTSFMLLGTIAGCAGLQPLSHIEENNQDSVVHVPSAEAVPELDSIEVEEDLVVSSASAQALEVEEEGEDENLSEELSQATETTALDLDLNYKKEHYDFWLKYFTGKDRERFVRHLTNGEEYREIIRALLKEEGLPADLFYVGLIESGYNLRIKSHASATGPWQFMKGTAKQYGLRVDSAVDERYNIYKATVAAAKYFRDLYNIFGSWELALCAYNAGEFRIIRAIRKGGTRDYRELVAKKLIPKETVYYIPKVAAARELSKRREAYNINVAKKDGLFYKNTILRTVKGRFDVNLLARDLGLSVEQFKLLNPDLRHRYIHAQRGHRIVLPQKLMSSFDSNDKLKVRQAKLPNTSSKGFYHKVRRGENLTLIAKRYGMSVSDLKRLNQLKGDLLFVGQKVKLYQGSQQASRQVAAVKKPSATVIFKVRPGDNLTSIAEQFGTSYHAIKRLNGLRSNKLYVGQKLKIPGSYNLRVYTVRRGDTLLHIARKFRTSLERLMAFNSLRSGQIYPNQKLKIPSEG